MMKQRISTLLGLYDREFYSKLVRLSLPIVLQQFMSAALFFVDNIMIGWLGENEIAAVGLANQLSFLYFMLLIGIMSGGGVFVAQLFGKKDFAEIRRIQGIILTFSFIVAGAAVCVALFIPEQFIGIFIGDDAVIALGAKYLRIVGWGYLGQSIIYAYSTVLKNCGKVVLPTISSAVALATNAAFNYVLIFGKLGFPALGVRGAAIATVIAVFTDAAIVVSASYIGKMPSAASARELFSRRRGLIWQYLRVAVPVIFNELGWSVGMLIYTYIYGLLGTSTVAAMQIHSVVDRISFFVFIAIGNACAIICGNQIGEGDVGAVRAYAARFIVLMVACSITIGAIVATLGPKLLWLYNIEASTRQTAQSVIVVYGSFIWVHAIVFLFIVGILRSGGDTVFASTIELLPMWLISIPLFYVSAVVLHWPIYLAYFGLLVGDAIKLALAVQRYRSGKWIRDVTLNKKFA